jgi:hypothetical protein
MEPERIATATGIEMLRALGQELDAGRYVRVLTGGHVTLDRDHTADGGSSLEHKEAEYANRSSAGPRQGSSRQRASWEGPTGQHPRQGTARAGTTPGGTPDSAAQVLSTAAVVAPAVLADVRGAEVEYPLDAHLDPSDLWLSTWIQPLTQLRDRAFVLVRYPLQQRVVRPLVWAWWHPGIRVGPRHTNPGSYGGGSICAVDGEDGLWGPGDPLVDLLDLCSVWLLRQLHLAVFARWPGPQRLHTAYERLTEHRPNELCGCGTLNRYERCCLDGDLAVLDKDLVPQFLALFPDPQRRIPADVADMRQRIWPWPVRNGEHWSFGRFIARSDTKSRWR